MKTIKKETEKLDLKDLSLKITLDRSKYPGIWVKSYWKDQQVDQWFYGIKGHFDVENQFNMAVKIVTDHLENGTPFRTNDFD